MWKQLASKPAHQLPSPSLWVPLSRTSVRPISATATFHGDATERTKSNIQHRDAMNPERAEGTLSSTDSEVAHHDTAYDPKSTRPETELEQTKKESKQHGKKGNPLEASPANKDINDWNGAAEKTGEKR